MKVGWLAAVLVWVGCSKPNPEVCCITEDDCTSIGVSDGLRPCNEGLACVDHACGIPTCSTEGCPATAPICDIPTDVCSGCIDSDDCGRFADTNLCDTTSGACVECLVDPDCDATKPVCDSGVCRTCKLDSECSSGACGDDGACVDGADIVYLSPTGTDAGMCDQTMPCKSVPFGISKTTATRTHLVFVFGSYVEPVEIFISATQTPSSQLVFHGGGATVSGTQSETLFGVTTPSTFRDLIIQYPGTAISGSNITLDHVKVQARTALSGTGPLNLHAVDLTASIGTGIALGNGSSLSGDGIVIRGGTSAIASALAVTVQVTNLVASGSTDVAIDLVNATGSVEFATIGNAGSSSTTASGIRCSINFAVRSSIVWTANTGKAPIVGGCSLVSVIAGPTGVVGAMNTDPLFVDNATDFHISPTSPARDAVNAGPDFDFEGDARPQGARFDIGADEAP